MYLVVKLHTPHNLKNYWDVIWSSEYTITCCAVVWLYFYFTTASYLLLFLFFSEKCPNIANAIADGDIRYVVISRFVEVRNLL
jgi:hypothetical protein